MKIKSKNKGLSLAEILVALTIASMIMVSVLMVYNRGLRSANAVTERIEKSKLPEEIMQGIAEDLDNIIASNQDTTITINNKFIDGYPASQMVINKIFYNEQMREQTFEKIVWLTAYNYETDEPGLILYRSHSGISGEDKILDKNKLDWEKELYIPFCSGITFFRIQTLNRGELADVWEKRELPDAVVVTLSFAEPYETLERTLDVPKTEKIKRTIVIDRTRRIAFRYVSPSFPQDLNEPMDSNDVNDFNDASLFGNIK